MSRKFASPRVINRRERVSDKTVTPFLSINMQIRSPASQQRGESVALVIATLEVLMFAEINRADKEISRWFVIFVRS